jgi:hypothetical protein
MSIIDNYTMEEEKSQLAKAVSSGLGNVALATFAGLVLLGASRSCSPSEDPEKRYSPGPPSKSKKYEIVFPVTDEWRGNADPRKLFSIKQDQEGPNLFRHYNDDRILDALYAEKVHKLRMEGQETISENFYEVYVNLGKAEGRFHPKKLLVKMRNKPKGLPVYGKTFAPEFKQ